MTFPAWVQQSAIAGLQAIVAELDVIAAANATDATSMANFSLAVALAPAISAASPAVTASVQGWANAASAFYNAIPFLVSDLTGVDPSVSAGLVSLTLGLVAAMDPSAAASAFAQAFDFTDTPPTPSAGTPNRLAYAQNASVAARFARMVYLAAYVQALANVSFTNRPDAITARADCATRFESELGLCSGATDLGVIETLTTMRDSIIAYLTQAIINSAPVLTVTAPALPAVVLAWRIYQDPDRAADLIARNAVAVAEFLPTTFEALAPANMTLAYAA